MSAEHEGDDYFKQQFSIDEQILELDELESVIVKFQDCFDDFEMEKNIIIS